MLTAGRRSPPLDARILAVASIGSDLAGVRVALLGEELAERRAERITRFNLELTRQDETHKRSGEQAVADAHSPEAQADWEALAAASPGSSASSQPTPPNPNVVDQLAKLADLRDRGVLSDAELEAQKKQLLGG